MVAGSRVATNCGVNTLSVRPATGGDGLSNWGGSDRLSSSAGVLRKAQDFGTNDRPHSRPYTRSSRYRCGCCWTVVRNAWRA